MTRSGAKSEVKAKNVMLATGSEAKMLPGLKAGRPHPDQHRNSRRCAQPPKSLIVIGAGAVGVEFGVDLPQLRRGGDDSRVSAAHGSGGGRGDFEGAGARVQESAASRSNTGAKVEKVETTDDGVKVSFTDANGKPQVKEAEKVLVAVGRAPHTADVGLEKTKDRAGSRIRESE